MNLIGSLTSGISSNLVQGYQRLDELAGSYPANHIYEEGRWLPFHRGQILASQSERRIVGVFAGTQGGKTKYGPWWLYDEINKRGAGDYLAVTATYDLFKLKMLPTLLEVFEQILQIGKYWAGDRILEICDPNGNFMANRSSDHMWARIILRSADAFGGLESSTAKGAWLDEAGQPSFGIQAYRAIRRRLAINQGRILITTTLYEPGWLDTEVFDKAERGDDVKTTVEHFGDAEVEYTDNPQGDVSLIQFDSIINPTYPIEEYREMQRDLPDDEFTMQYRGRRTRLRILIYDNFDEQMDVCTPFPIPLGWRRYAGMDYGPVNTVGVYYAEDPGTGILYGYREYHAGGRTAQEHVNAMLAGEPGIPFVVGGARSEEQWRMEFSQSGLPVHQPQVSDVKLGINLVYSGHAQHQIIYFDTMTGILGQKKKYKWKRDRMGEPTREIENKNAFHYLDAERYIISHLRFGKPSTWDDMEGLGTIEDHETPYD